MTGKPHSLPRSGVFVFRGWSCFGISNGRETLATHVDLARKLNKMEKYDTLFKVVFEAIRAVMAPPRNICEILQEF